MGNVIKNKVKKYGRSNKETENHSRKSDIPPTGFRERERGRERTKREEDIIK